jgi:monofunctional glycosyltransferase
VTARPNIHFKTPLGKVRSVVRWLVIVLAVMWLLTALMLLLARWIDPPTTAVHVQRHLQGWHEIQIAAEDDLGGGRTRGASTITQQLVKNLFFGTGRSILRKGAEFTLVPVAEVVLGKQRILEIYLNIVEWGPGVYGAESACHFYDGTSARNIGRQQAARLAAILPAPLKRRPERMNNYSALILERMRQMGW